MIHTSERELAKLILFSLGAGDCVSTVGSLLWSVRYNGAQGRCWSAATELGLLYERAEPKSVSKRQTPKQAAKNTVSVAIGLFSS